jgi:hypothetical protein
MTHRVVIVVFDVKNFAHDASSAARFSERTVDGTDFRDMGAILVLLNPRKYFTSCRAGARPGHPITGRCGCIVAV